MPFAACRSQCQTSRTGSCGDKLPLRQAGNLLCKLRMLNLPWHTIIFAGTEPYTSCPTAFELCAATATCAPR